MQRDSATRPAAISAILDARWTATRHGWILLALLAATVALRLPTLGFGLPALNDPDELMFEMGALRMLRGPTLNPGWFGHPATTTMYVLALADVAAFTTAWCTGRAASVKQFGDLVYVDPSWLIVPGRFAIVLFAVATVFLAWRIARRLAGPRAGFAAAVLLAVSPVHVTYSQIIRSDMMACFFMLLCLDACLTIARRGSARAFILAALWLGLAIATKWPFALSGLAICGATCVAIHDGVIDRRRGLSRLVGTGLGALAILLLASPFLVLDAGTVLRNIQGEGQTVHLGATGMGFWRNIGWYASGPLLTGFGFPGAIFVIVGLYRLARERLALSLLAPVGAAFALLLASQHLVWERWALPLIVLGAIIGGMGLAACAGLVARRGRRHHAPAVAALLLAATATPSIARILMDNRARATDTRQLASAWARHHVAPGSTVLVEHFAFDLLDEPWRFLFPMGDAGCVDVRAALRGKIDYATIERARVGRSNVDYGTVAPKVRSTCRADVIISSQYARYRSEAYRFPAQYAAYRSLLNEYTVAATFRPSEGRIGGPTIIILRTIRLRR